MGKSGNATGVHTHVEIREFSNGKVLRKINASEYMGIPNVVGEYDSNDYQIDRETMKFAVNTNIREEPSLKGKAHLYKANTTVEILQKDVANADGYVWDKVRAIATNRVGYVARTANRYK